MEAVNHKTFLAIADTRDKDEYRWTFSSFTKDKEFEGVEIKKLDVGDYSIVGLEDILAIERKKSVEEIANNISKNDEARFKRELIKLKEFKYPFLICEFTIHDLFRGSRYTSLSPAYVLSVLMEIETVYGINVHFAGKEAEALCYRIMRKVWFLEKGSKRWL